MADSPDHRVLAVNTGSSSLKAALYRMDAEAPLLAVGVRPIGTGSRIRITAADGVVHEQRADVPDHTAALQLFLDWLEQHDSIRQIAGVGHRVVHGGSAYDEPQRVTPALLGVLRELIPLAPDHLPAAIGCIELVGGYRPALPQVACFDTAFHRRMPRLAQRYALPAHFYDEGVMRFGFHGLSYEFILQQVRSLEPALADGRIIVAHLGNGASMAAIRGGACIDTTMGFTPASGLVMGTRCGDIDAGALLYLIEWQKMAPAAVDALINRESGLLGISGSSGDMQELLKREAADPRAAEAIEAFCYRARKYLGAYAAALGGLDMLVFTGGIGEHAVAVRERICSGLAFLGIELDPACNRADAPLISSQDSRVSVRVIRTDEERMIAQHVEKLISD